jgi:hypothetical protein
MSNTTTMISSLTARFPAAEELFTHLKSAEGGRLVIRKEQATPDFPFAMIHYDKATSDMTNHNTNVFRSVVWNMETNQPACVGPARGLPLASLDALPEGAIVEEFVDGVMINMFYDGTAWRLATRTQINARGNFYGKRPFADLFWESFKNAGLSVDSGLFETDLTYSWVLQHPEERIVIAPTYGIPKLYLVDSNAKSLPSALEKLRPKRYDDLNTVEDIKERVAQWGKRYAAKWQGLVVKAVDGTRYKIRSDEYNAARQLRGNQAKLPFVWLERWSEGRRFGDYLKLFPEEKTDAEAVVEAFKACTQELYDLYQKVYRRKELPLGSAPQKYRKLLWDCHQEKAGAYFPNCRTFMNKQDTARKLWLVNYERRYGSVAAEATTE